MEAGDEVDIACFFARSLFTAAHIKEKTWPSIQKRKAE